MIQKAISICLMVAIVAMLVLFVMSAASPKLDPLPSDFPIQTNMGYAFSGAAQTDLVAPATGVTYYNLRA